LKRQVCSAGPSSAPGGTLSRQVLLATDKVCSFLSSDNDAGSSVAAKHLQHARNLHD
jgi:hypothetical protein